jgi:cytochrome c
MIGRERDVLDEAPARRRVVAPARVARTRVTVRAALFAAAALVAGHALGETPRALLERHACYDCHSNDEAKAGPAFADIATAYRGNPKAVALLAATVRKGAHGSGPWHMPPHPEVSEADADAMVRYILALKK